ncbi:hypothetical protein [Nocardia vaccinii]|uniref:hypothetical protein n=1 Tax=Nocardia vaccinii TaxID=1822 RepID=UPI0008295336|nr:hypothetical protein [Nocardia vaccinii]
MTAIECAECARPLGHNAVICRNCVDGLAEQLLMVPALIGELTVTRAGLGRSGTPSIGGRPSEPPLPIRATGRGRRMIGDSAVLRLETAVIGWARVISEELGVIPAVNVAYLVQMTQDRRRLPDWPVPRPDAAALGHPVSAVEQAAVWLAHHRREIAMHDAADELARDVSGAIGSLAAIIWPAERQYLGLCTTKDAKTFEPCGQELRAEIGQAYVHCRRCKWRYDVSELKAEALEHADDRLFKVADLLRVMDGFGQPIARSTLYRWARERRIEPRGWEHRDEYGTRITDHRIGENDVQVYRLGDARKLAAGEHANQGGSAA